MGMHSLSMKMSLILSSLALAACGSKAPATKAAAAPVTEGATAADDGPGDDKAVAKVDAPAPQPASATPESELPVPPPPRTPPPVEEFVADDDEEEEGVEGGVAGGVVGGVLGGGGQLGAPPPPPPPPPRPKIVSPRVFESHRIAGDRHIAPSEAVKQQIAKDGKTKVIASVKVCIGKHGSLTTTRLIRASGYRDYDRALLTGIRTWRYKPFTIKGKPATVCSSVMFVYVKEATSKESDSRGK